MQRSPFARGKLLPAGLFAAPARRGFVIASVLPLCIASAHAMQLDFADGDVKGRFDNTVSWGLTARTKAPDSSLSAQTDVAGPTGYYSQLVAENIRTQANKNDGDNNFPKAGEIVSDTVKWNSLLELTWDKYGAQVSGYAFHDFRLADLQDSYGKPQDFLNSVDSSDRFDNRRLTPEAARYSVSHARLSSGYVWGDFELGSRTMNVRFGEQVLSWGEALFMQDGINQVNPADLSALHLPGAEIKDALLPLPMLVMSTQLTDALSTEAFYEFGWHRSEADPVGTFYSTTDAFFGWGSEAVIIDLEDPTHGANSTLAQQEALARIYNVYERGITSPTDPMGTRISNNKLADVKPPDDGQYGVSFRYLAESLNNTEFGFYFENYHARKPTAGAVLGNAFGSATDNGTCAAAYSALMSIGVTPSSCADTMNILAGSQGASAAAIVGGLNAIHYIDTTSYFLQYEKNQQLFGLSFSTTVGSNSFSGEVAYRPDAAFLPEVGDNLIVYNALNAQTLGNGGSVNSGAPSKPFGDHIGNGGTLTAGQTISVSDNKDMVNASLLGIHNFGPTLGMDGLTGVLELGGAWVNGLNKQQLYAAEGALAYVPGVLQEGNPSQYLDRFSWGYRLVLAADFNDVLAGLNLKPQIRYAQDVNGNGVVGGNFMEGRKSATLGLEAEYSGNWNFGIGANIFWGRDGVNEGNQLADRDNVFANVKYSF